MSMPIDELNSIYGMYGINGLSQNNTQSISSNEAEEKATDGDSYISTIAGMDPTEYSSVEESADSESQNIGAAGGSGGGSSSDSDDETETEVVTINGQTYLQITKTDSNGNTTVTRTPIGAAASDDGK